MILTVIGVAALAFFVGLISGSLIKEFEVRRYVDQQVSFAKVQEQGFKAKEDKIGAACWGSRANELEVLTVRVLEKRAS